MPSLSPHASEAAHDVPGEGVNKRALHAATAPGRHVTILMATYNGAAHLGDQLRSLVEQTHEDWSLVVSDDGSSDGTLEILATFAAGRCAGSIEILDGPSGTACDGASGQHEPRELATRNFLTMVVGQCRPADYFAFADQDDIWESDKLERAVAWLEACPAGVPALYCSRTRLMDEGGRVVGMSPRFRKPPSLRNALVQSLAGGNTIVINRAARDVVAAAGVVPVVAHDWWMYLLVTGSGGMIHYDPEPSVLYRQHASNLVGSNRGLAALLSRAHLVWDGGWARWTDRHLAALEAAGDLLTPSSRAMVRRFAELRRGRLSDRWRLLTELGLYRQTWMGQLSLLVAVASKRL